MRKQQDSLEKIGTYRILGKIGRGGSSIVYQAKHLILSERPIVAIKLMAHKPLIEENDREKFLREARFLDRLKHPCILPILDINFENNYPYIVTEFAPKGSLRGSSVEDTGASWRSPALCPQA
jgi:serine/threonine protein kinase